MSTLREQLISIVPAASPSSECQGIFYAKGCQAPEFNHLDVQGTLIKFCGDFLPQCPIIDPRNQQVKIRKDNFPKFLNLEVRKGFSPKKSSTIVQEIEAGKFKPEEYKWASDRIEALFWVPDVIRDPDAIFRKKREHGLVKASEIYVKVFDKSGSKVKLVFVDRVGKVGRQSTIFITSYLTAPHTAIKYCDGLPLYTRK